MTGWVTGWTMIPREPDNSTPQRTVCSRCSHLPLTVIAFTHDIVMDWMLPGIAPTGRRVEVPLIVIVQLRVGEVVCERIYWDQASVLVQLGLLEPSHLPVAGADTARKVLNPGLPSNDLIRRAAAKPGHAGSNLQSV